MYRSYVGLEIHVQLLTRSKIFCACRAGFGDEPNTNVCPVCLGYPGVLPALNAEAIEMAYTVARALNCDLSRECAFDRKNYFYPDLPKNYQISQYHAPLGTGGFLDLEFRKKKKRVRIHQIHLEEDAGKMIHAGDMSLLDYNRTGTPLLEIVTEPDLEIGEEAEALLQELRRIVRYLGVCDGNMEEGSLRCDANVSVNWEDAGLGNKVEIKNLNSSRFVRKALNFEIERQQDIMERGGTVMQETRLWNENRDQSESMRTKEMAHDYRYFPEPDLPHFHADQAFLNRVEERMVELPAGRRSRLRRDWNLSAARAEFLCDEKATADFFEEALQAAPGIEAEQVATWLAGDVRKRLNRAGLELAASPLTPVRLAELLLLLADGTIHGKIAKQTLELVFDQDKDPATIIEEQGWKKITDRDVLQPVVTGVIAENPRAAGQVRAGDNKPAGFLMGQVMKATGGRAEPGVVQALLDELLAAGTDVLDRSAAVDERRDAGEAAPIGGSASGGRGPAPGDRRETDTESATTGEVSAGAPRDASASVGSAAGEREHAHRGSAGKTRIQVLSFGGAIAGRRREDGLVTPGDLVSMTELFQRDSGLPDRILFDEVHLGQFLSEEITPADWAALLVRIAESLETQNVQGIVVSHGTDTLAYTASLVYWFFADTTVPVVLTAGAVPTETGGRGESVANLRRAVSLAAGAEAGVHVVYGEHDYMPLNLRFERVLAPDRSGKEADSPASGENDAGGEPGAGAFRTWNPAGLRRRGTVVGTSAREASRENLTAAMEIAMRRTFVVRVFPGMPGDTVIALMDAGIRFFILEIFDTGTANLRETPFSLKKAFTRGRERGVVFFCTSQQEGMVDFSEYVTAHELWRGGAIPMGALTTESTFTRLITAQVEAMLEHRETAGDPGVFHETESFRERVIALMEE